MRRRKNISISDSDSSTACTLARKDSVLDQKGTVLEQENLPFLAVLPSHRHCLRLRREGVGLAQDGAAPGGVVPAEDAGGQGNLVPGHKKQGFRPPRPGGSARIVGHAHSARCEGGVCNAPGLAVQQPGAVRGEEVGPVVVEGRADLRELGPVQRDARPVVGRPGQKRPAISSMIRLNYHGTI